MPNLLSAILAGAASLTAVWLLSLRIGGALMFTPLFSSSGVPVRIRVLVVLGLAVALSAALPTAAGPGGKAASVTPLDSLVHSPGALIESACVELALGATLAVGIHLAFAAFTMAGRMLDVQIGFGLAQVFDPATSANQPLLSTAFNQIAVVVFFLIDGHHALLRGLAYSLERFPLGQRWPIDAALLPITKQVGGLLGLAFALAAPVAFCILIVEFALGVLARNLPQMNMLSMGIPIKIVVGLVATSLWLGGIGGVMGRIYGGIYETWDAVLAAPAAAPSLPARPR